MVTMPIRRQQCGGLGQGSPESSICFESVSNIYGMVSLITRIHGSRNQRVEKGIAPLTTTPSNSLGKLLLSVPATLSSAGLEVLVPEGKTFLLRATPSIPLNWKLRVPLYVLGF